MGNTPSPGRRLIFMGGLEGKTEEELAEEVWQAYRAYQQAEEQGTDFEPVLDIDHPEPE